MKKRCDDKNRWRNKTVAFRMSPEEAERLDVLVRLSGLSKQDYLIRKSLDKKVVIQGNPRTYKALRNQFTEVFGRLKELESVSQEQEELIALIRHMVDIMNGFKEGSE